MIGVGVIGIVGVIDLGVTEIPMSYIDPPSTNGGLYVVGFRALASPLASDILY